MHINKIVVKGIASFKEKTVFNIEQGKVYLIHGEVGSGKSTFFQNQLYGV